jgi:F-type H+-transporting ATPase subunit gamma
MKALAASSIGQYEKAVASLGDYYHTVELGLGACFRAAGPPPVAANDRSAKKRAVGAVIFGSDQGLVGQFNEVLADFATHALGALPGKTIRIWTVGDRMHELMAEAARSPSGALPVPASVNAITPLVDRILVELESARERGEVSEVFLFHNHPKAGAVYEPVGKQLRPLDRRWQQQLAALPWPTKSRPEVIGGAALALPAFIRGYLFVLLFQACAESLASENASRLAAMQRAEKNIEEIQEELGRTYHRLRQEAIDEELFDVISGYEALARRPGRP